MDLKKFANSRVSETNFKSFSRSLEQFFLTVAQNNFGNKIQFFFGFMRFDKVAAAIQPTLLYF